MDNFLVVFVTPLNPLTSLILRSQISRTLLETNFPPLLGHVIIVAHMIITRLTIYQCYVFNVSHYYYRSTEETWRKGVWSWIP